MNRLCDTCIHRELCPYHKAVMDMASKFWYDNEIYFCVTECKHCKEEAK